MKADKERAQCPRCEHPGAGPYARWVLNGQKRRYEPYYYFHHEPSDGARKEWCYIPKKAARRLYQELSNSPEASQPKLPEKLSNYTQKPKRESEAKKVVCRRCRHFSTFDGRPFCRWSQSILMPETFTQPCDCFEEGKR